MQSQPASHGAPASSNGFGLLTPFDFAPRTRVVFGSGTVERLGELAHEQGGRRVLLVTDRGVRQAGPGEQGRAILAEAGLDVVLFDDVNPNPTTDDVDRGLAVARDHRTDLIVGLGGGSAMDCAKGINFLLTNGGRMEDYHGVGKATRPMLPMLAVPTTAGTGSEAQSFAVIAQARTHMKMACGDKKAACRVALLDPALTVSMPPSVTAATGIDALSHALETYVTKPRNIVSQLFSRRAWQLLAKAFPKVIEQPDNLEARGAMLLGAHWAGAAIEYSMLGATHALANPLSAHFDLTHGVAIAVMLPHVIRYNGEVAGKQYGELAADLGLCDATDPAAPRRLADFVRTQAARAGLPTTLAECGVDPERIPQMADEAARQWTGRFNPRPVDADHLKELYQCAFAAECATPI